MSGEQPKTCIYPGCERPALPPHPLGSPQPHPQRRLTLADEAYRAVFLRIHPTGKMVLSLTTEADGNETGYAQLVANELGVPRSTSRSSRQTRTASARATASTRARLRARRGRSSQRPARSKQAQLLAGVARWAPADSLKWDNGAFVADSQSQTIADLALYAHSRGELPPGVEGGLDAQTVYRD